MNYDATGMKWIDCVPVDDGTLITGTWLGTVGLVNKNMEVLNKLLANETALTP